MESINPREILKNVFSSFKNYPPNKVKIVVFTDEMYGYYISINNGKYSITQMNTENDEETELPDINNVNEFFDILKPLNQKITRIELENFPRRRQQLQSFNIFSCQQGDCYDQRNKSISNDLKQSRLLSKITSHPEYLRQEGYFNQLDFGKKQKKIKHPKKQNKIKLPNNTKLGPTLKGYNTGIFGSIVVVSINRKIHKSRLSRDPQQGYFRAKIKGNIYRFKSSGPGRFVTLKEVRSSSFGKKKGTLKTLRSDIKRLLKC